MPITNLIPYFGQDDKDIFIYRFTDKGAKTGIKYDYRLEIVKPEYKTGLNVGKLMINNIAFIKANSP